MNTASKNPCSRAVMPEPAIYTQSQLNAAVAAEREACAKVCEEHARDAWDHEAERKLNDGLCGN